MAVLPFRPTPFFANKNRAFWRLQVLGWGGAMLLRAMSSLANGQPFSFTVVILIQTLTGFSISLILSVAYRFLIRQRPLVTWGLSPPLLLLAVAFYAFIDAWVIQLYRADTAGSYAQLFIGVFYLDLTLLGLWSALYYAINFYLQVE
jgi:two-component system, LytTR family, sensor kinase